MGVALVRVLSRSREREREFLLHSDIYLTLVHSKSEIRSGVSLWHKDAYNRTFPCMEATYPSAIKTAKGKKCFGCLELVLYGIRELASATP